MKYMGDGSKKKKKMIGKIENPASLINSFILHIVTGRADGCPSQRWALTWAFISSLIFLFNFLDYLPLSDFQLIVVT